MQEDTAGQLASSGRTTALICAVLLVLFTVLCWSAARTKSPTYDEPLHATAGYVTRFLGDYRIDPEDPALFCWLTSLPQSAGDLRINRADGEFIGTLKTPPRQWPFLIHALFQTPGNDGEALVQRSRIVFLLIGIAAGALVGWWAWKLAGAAAAVVATALFALDPNFLAHSPLVKNDVSITLALLALMYAVWRLGERATWGGLLTVGLLCGVAATIKFSGVIFAPLAMIALLSRAAMRHPWEFRGRVLKSALERIVAAAGACLLGLIISYFAIWAVYRFRFSPADDGRQFDLTWTLTMTRANELYAAHPGAPVSDAELSQWQPDTLTRLVLYADENRLLPQALLCGLLHTHMSSLVRCTYLLGEVRKTGWWYYFPLAMLFKTPLATLLAIAGASFVGARAWLHRKTNDAAISQRVRWAAVCLALPAIVYAVMVMRSNLNLGLRHVLPIYPFIYIAVAVAGAHAWKRYGLGAKVVTGALLLVLAVESFVAYPNFIPFFNLAAGGSRGGFRLLGDSNLDWGQDLKLLAHWSQQWHAENPGKKLYLRYFGIADPAFYGIDYVNLPGGYVPGPPMHSPDVPGVVAISATHLQGIYDDTPEQTAMYQPYRKARPFAVLGGSIYLFEYPLPP